MAHLSNLTSLSIVTTEKTHSNSPSLIPCSDHAERKTGVSKNPHITLREELSTPVA
uniref:Uncharacterized protein n=1 Tax=Arundo donax TaxID=35708 RepID=A0A0A8YJ79_ARUDO